jgi:tetratricopeptide (TPR) repeat protein
MLVKDIAYSQGDNLGALGSRASLKLYVAGDRAWAHDGARGEAEAEAFVPRSPVDARTRAQMLADIARARGDWALYLTRLDAALKAPPVTPETLSDKANRTAALAQLGRVAEAHAVIDPTPLDCQPCIVARGVLASAEGRRVAADHWFAEASRIGPSTPNGPLYWGQALLARGDAAQAVVRFREAVRRSPRADDAREGLGEALALRGDAAGAVREYAAAARLTPRWGRLHLKWGEALMKQGRRDEARAQFARAASLDLTATERAELATQRV